MPERVQMYGRRLTAQQKDEDKIKVTRNDLCVTTRAIYFTHWLVQWIGGGQHGVISPALPASLFWSFHVLRVRHLMRMHILISDTSLTLYECIIPIAITCIDIFAWVTSRYTDFNQVCDQLYTSLLNSGCLWCYLEWRLTCTCTNQQSVIQFTPL